MKKTLFRSRVAPFISCFATFLVAACQEDVASKPSTAGNGTVASISPSSAGSESSIIEPLIRIRRPADFVQSGFGTTLHVELKALALESALATANRVGRALSLTDASGEKLPIQVTGSFDGNGIALLDVSSTAALTPQGWYYLQVPGVPGEIDLDGDDGSWTLSLYTGDLVYVQRVMQPADPDKQDEVFLRFSQPVNFDAEWSTHILADANGNAVRGCVVFNGGCQTSGQISTREVQLNLPKGAGNKIARLVPEAMHATIGHAAVGMRSLLAQKTFPDESVAIAFQSCEHGSGQCGFF